jgi:DNA helicase-2/ATP-dependent DNA helicase PcrA
MPLNTDSFPEDTVPHDQVLDRSFVSELNPEQQEAVLQTDGPLLILAGAGSGKTRVIAYRVAYLIGGGFAEMNQVLAVTFTNKAADEMRDRVGRLLHADCKRLWISTFHALCARLLRREAPAIGLSRDFVIYDSADQQAAVKQILKDLSLDDKLLPPRAALSRISQAKNRMEGPEAIRSGWNLRDEQISQVYARYLDVLRECNALDFDDLLLKTVELFEKAEPVRRRYAQRFRYVMVDEYQDTNRPQYLLVKQLAGEHRNLAVVGDPDQSIYKWRGADLRNILDFEQDFPEARIVRLERNYRSTQVILDAASAVIQQNRNRKEKRLYTEMTGGARILYFRGSDDLAEADFISRTARAATGESGSGNVAVLYRMNAQSRAVEDALMRDGIPYRIVGGVRFYERKETKDALAYLKLVLNPHDDVSFRRVVNVPPRGIGKTVMEALDSTDPTALGPDAPPLVAAGLHQTASSRSLWARTVHLLGARQLPTRAHQSLKAFHDLLAKLGEIARTEDVARTLARLLDVTGYLEMLREEHSEEAEERVANLMELVSTAGDYLAREADASLGGFVDRLSLLSEVDEEQGTTAARVWLMTLHAAKGLEFPTVIIAGMEEGVFPHSRAQDTEADVEEERRLCYVGMTRAQRALILTGSARRRVFGEYQSSTPSRFLDEVPSELVDRRDAQFGGTASGAGWQTRGGGYVFRTGPSPRREAPQAKRPYTVREDVPVFRDEDEDQSTSGGPRVGARVRHPQFGVGTVVSIEPAGDDTKMTVRFASVGVKKLMARFARLTLA